MVGSACWFGIGVGVNLFSDGNNGTFAYSVDLADGVNKANQMKAITRQVFRAPAPSCFPVLRAPGR